MWKLLEAVKLLHRKGLAHGGLHAQHIRVCAESLDRLMIIGFSNTKPIENPASVEDDCRGHIVLGQQFYTRRRVRTK
jgi:hypothetical protein